MNRTIMLQRMLPTSPRHAMKPRPVAALHERTMHKPFTMPLLLQTINLRISDHTFVLPYEAAQVLGHLCAYGAHERRCTPCTAYIPHDTLAQGPHLRADVPFCIFTCHAITTTNHEKASAAHALMHHGATHSTCASDVICHAIVSERQF